MSKLQVDTIVNKNDDGAPTLTRGAVVTGVITATGANVTGIVTHNQELVKVDQELLVEL